MRERIDRVRAVIAGNRRDEKTPDEHLSGAGAELGGNRLQECAQAEHADGKEHRDHDIKAIEPLKFRELQKISDSAQIGLETASG